MDTFEKHTAEVNAPARLQDAGGTTRPTYAAAFHCIGSSCEEICCREWNIPIDKATYEKYRQFPAEKLGSLVSQFVSISPAGSRDALYAEIRQGPSGCCAFLDGDRLCRIQKDYGPQFLTASCSTYPRSLSHVEGELEGSLSLSCPEAARQVLLDPEFFARQGDLLHSGFRTDNVFFLSQGETGLVRKPKELYLEIRTAVVRMLQDRSSSLPSRLLRIGLFCKRLDETAATGGLFNAIRNYPELAKKEVSRLAAKEASWRLALRLQVVMALSQDRIQEGAEEGFQESFAAFLEHQKVEQFMRAEQEFYRPFVAERPFLLENYLLNFIFQTLFPYGRTGSANFDELSMYEAFIRMSTQFAWLRVFLVGIAGHYGEEFQERHVVRTVQSFVRTIEHYPDVIRAIDEYVRRCGLATMEGMALLLGS